jgi:hypothetical protein
MTVSFTKGCYLEHIRKYSSSLISNLYVHRLIKYTTSLPTFSRNTRPSHADPPSSLTRIMRSATIILSSLLAICTPSLATICWGNGWPDFLDNNPAQLMNVAYIDSTFSVPNGLEFNGLPTNINPQGQNPCGTTFDIDSFHTGYTLQGCGGDSLWLDQNGQVNAACVYRPATVNVGLTGQSFQQLYCC